MSFRKRYTLAVCCSLAIPGCGSSSRHAPPPKRSPVSKVRTGGAPIGLLAYAGQLWVADARTNRVLRVQPQSGRITARVPVGRTPLRIVDGKIWSTDFGSGTVSVVSPSDLRRVATVRVGPQPEGIVPFGADVWVVSQKGGYLVRIVPGSSRPANRVLVGHQPRQVTAGAGNLWVSVFADNAVVEVDPRTRRVIARIRACQGPQGLAYAAGQLWVGCTDGSELVDIDAASRRVLRRIRYEAADAVTRTGFGLRVTSDNGPSTGVLDPSTGELSHKVQLSDAFIGDANADVVAAGDGIWVSSPDEGTVYRVPPS
jgi:YVTN family beta-propeller protein